MPAQEVIKAPTILNEQMNAYVCTLIDRGITRDEAMQEFEKLFLIQLLARNRGNRCKAARDAGMHRNTISRLIAEHKIDSRRIRELSSGGRKRPAAACAPRPQQIQQAG